MKKGTFCISIDTELLWGRKHRDYKPFVSRVKKERKIIKRLLDLFDEHEMAATWAIVGKMLDNSTKNGKNPQLWYGLDIFEEIRKHKIHEIASHSYSHVFFGEIGKKEAEEELKAWGGIDKKFRIKSTSFIFPKNSIGHFALIKKCGFNAYRSPDPHEREILIPAPPPVHNPKLSNGLVDIPGSMYYVSARGLRKHIPAKLRFIKAKMGIDRAMAESKLFHLWFHPVDFADNEEDMFKVFELILAYAAQKNKEGLLEIKTMKGIAREVLA